MNFFSFKYFITLLNEGGNVVLSTGEAAQKIPIDKINIDQVRKMILIGLKEFNKKFETTFKKELWPNFDDLVKKEKLFSGSSRLFFSYHNMDEFKKFKSTVGDIDTMIPKENMPELKIFLNEVKGEKFGELRYIGAGGNSILQENVIFEFPKDLHKYVRYFQVDFEPIDYNKENNEPTAFAILSHYSDFNDLKAGVKGAAVKILYRAIFSDIEKLSNYLIMTDKGKLSKSKKFEDEIGKWGFSVDYGVRMKYAPVLENGKHKKIDDKFVYRELDPKESEYINSLETIFEMAFNFEPNDINLKQMHSFVGVLELIKKSHQSKIDNYFERFLDECWGENAQSLERENFQKDLDDKMAAASKFLEIHPKLEKYRSKMDNMIKTYYSGKREIK